MADHTSVEGQRGSIEYKLTSRSQLIVIRHRQIIDHKKNAFTAEITDEFTIINQSHQDMKEIVLEDRLYRHNLHIYDADSSELPFLTNDVIKAQLKVGESEDAKKIIRLIESHERYFLVIPLTQHQRLKPGEARVIKLVYPMTDEPGFLGQTESIFSIPYYHFDVDLNNGVDFQRFLIIIPPSDLQLNCIDVVIQKDGETISQSQLVDKGVRKTVNARIAEISVRKGCEADKISIWYDIHPNLFDMHAITVIFWGFVSICVMFLIFLQNPFPMMSIPKYLLFFEPIHHLVLSDAAYIISALVLFYAGFLGFASNPFTNRPKVLMALALGIVLLVMTYHFA